SEGSGADDFSELKKITALLAKAFNRRKFYSKLTNNNLRTSSTSQSNNKKQEFVKTNENKVEKKADEKKRDLSKVLLGSDKSSSSAEETIVENDREDIGKLGAKGDICFFAGYSADSCAYRVYNRRTQKIMETMNVLFDELSAMAFEQRSSKPRLKSELDLLFEAMYDDYIGGQPSATARTVPPA
nr:retrovirus-related Pol polyprotein from transposon TNT 1-94 [Tanacetum cinerariifolium]